MIDVALLIDQGNTRLKWVLARNGVIEEKSAGQGGLEAFMQAWGCDGSIHPDSVLFSSVASKQDALALDAQAAYDGDPAAKSIDEVIYCYPGFYAISAYRIAHELVTLGVPLMPRILSEYAHSATGTDIHPGATIGESFFIDHATGVVIGETTEIGDHVKIYQGVTLGARSFPKDERGKVIKGHKRHPTLMDNVTVYPNATILGGNTVIGKGVTIGGNAYVTESVDADTVVKQPAPKLHVRGKTIRKAKETG